jgi:predicted nucleotidyltransferase
MLQPTAYPHVNEFLDTLLARLQRVLGQKLVGLYLYGSLVTGDFDDDTSDIDLLAAVSTDLDEAAFQALDRMQGDLLAAYPRWENRLEIAYYSLHGLKTFKTQSSPIGIISPGEPFHLIQAGKEWLLNWYIVREKGLTLFGPPPQAIIEPTSKEEYIQTVKEHAAHWREYVNDAHTRPSQAYAILTMCRALYTTTNGEHVSKKQAAGWAAQQMPEWASLIQNALLWRKAWREPVPNPEATLPETKRFVHAVTDRILG